MLEEKYKNKLTEIINKYVSHCNIYLFGSRTTNQHAKHADIDIAIDAKQKLQTTILGKIKEEVEESTIPLFVDIVDFNNIAEDLKNQIVKYGKIWKN